MTATPRPRIARTVGDHFSSVVARASAAAYRSDTQDEETQMLTRSEFGRLDPPAENSAPSHRVPARCAVLSGRLSWLGSAPVDGDAIFAHFLRPKPWASPAVRGTRA